MIGKKSMGTVRTVEGSVMSCKHRPSLKSYMLTGDKYKAGIRTRYAYCERCGNYIRLAPKSRKMFLAFTAVYSILHYGNCAFWIFSILHHRPIMCNLVCTVLVFLLFLTKEFVTWRSSTYETVPLTGEDGSGAPLLSPKRKSSVR